MQGDLDTGQTEHRRTDILGVPVSLINMRQAKDIIFDWVDRRKSNYVCVRDVHGIMRAQDDKELFEIHRNAGMITPDGMPLVWISKWRKNRDVGRVSGADLVSRLCEASVEKGFRHYFYGGKDGVAQRMTNALISLYPGLIIAGTHTPPFRALSSEEDAEVTAKIASVKPDIVWVGLSTPKQEYWMRDHVGRIPGATLIGVGAAFDFFAGDVSRAPPWMQHSGLEWLHRLCSEPTRLWRRYLVMAPQFVFRVMLGKRSAFAPSAKQTSTRQDV